jgi:hypothetical protein
MEKMIFLLLAMCLIGNCLQHLRFNDPFANDVRLHPERHFLPLSLRENFAKIPEHPLQSILLLFIFHVKNTGKIFFPPAFQPKALGG